MADKRAFAQFDVGYLDNPKIMEVFDASPIAVCMHFASVLYCAQHLTDGVIALRAMQRKVGASDADVALLVSADLWHLPGHECPGCPDVVDGKAYVHDYLQHNRTSDGVKGRSEAGKKGAAARWGKGESDADANANRMRVVSEPQSDVAQIAMAREKERKKERDNTPSPLAAAEFDSFWKDYPRKIGKEAARKAFAKALRLTDFATIMEGVVSLRMEVAGKDPKFTPHAATWLNAGRWDDETDAQQPAIVPAGYAWANR